MTFKYLPAEVKEILVKEKFSTSEKHGLSLVRESDLIVYCPGISTGGVAELKLAIQNPRRKIIATTIDTDGLKEVSDYITLAGLNNQIQTKNEDVSEKLDYSNNTFDFIYARLLLHYLPKQKLDNTLIEFHRILKPKGKIFIVVRSVLDPDTQIPGSTYDANTRLTTYFWKDEKGIIHPEKPISRYFHSQITISDHLKSAGFNIVNIEQYDEQLYLDFSRKKISSQFANLIEVVADK